MRPTGLKAKSDSLREQRRKERLDAYMVKNYGACMLLRRAGFIKDIAARWRLLTALAVLALCPSAGDYFDFVQGSQREGSLTENDKAIRAWLEKSAAKR